MNPYIYPARQNLILTGDDVLSAVSFMALIPIDKIRQKDKTPGARCRKYVIARQTTTYILNTFCNFTLADAGECVNRDHASVVHGNKQVENELETNPRFRDYFAKIISYCFMYDRQKRNITLYAMKMITQGNVYIISNHPIFI